MLSDSDQRPVEATVCWIVRDGKALLKLANSGISAGKWNAVGGKVEPGETPLECAKREAFEETGLAISDAAYRGKLTFLFVDESGKSKADEWVMHVFAAGGFSGEMKASDEGELRWFDIERMPFGHMWEDDVHWVPLLLQGKSFEGRFVFSKEGNRMLEYELAELGKS